MGLFSKRKSDEGRAADDGSRARDGERETQDSSERPTEPAGTAQAPGARAEPPAAPIEPPEPAAEEPVVRRAEGSEGGTETGKPREPDMAGIEKDELRRAVGGPARNGSASGPAATEESTGDEQRVSAEDLIAPSPTRKHPFQPEPASERGARRVQVYAFANQKGGVAKTTTTLNLAVALKESGHQVLCIDLDPQGNLTMSQGIDPDEVDKSMFDVLVDRVPISDVIQEAEVDIAVSSIDLAGAEIAMSTQIGRERSLQKALTEIENTYDFVCIDTPPSLGLLTINALTAADRVIVPVQCEYLSMRGLVQLQNTLQMIRENLNPDVRIEGILPTMLDSRTVHAKEAVEILEENFGELVFKSRIKKAIKFAEAPVKGSSVLKYDPDGNAARYYRDLAEEVLTHGQAT
jgi:chromosome partitioning protein